MPSPCFLLDADAVFRGDVLQFLVQRLPAPVDAAHDGADGEVEDLHDLLVGESFDVGVVDHHAIVLADIRQRVDDVPVRDPLERFNFRGGETVRSMRHHVGLLLVGHVLRRGFIGSALLLAALVDVGVGEDAVQPGFEVGAGLEGSEGLEGLDIRIPHEVLCIGGVASHPQRRTVELVQQRQRVAFEAGEQLLVGLLGALRRGALRVGELMLSPLLGQ